MNIAKILSILAVGFVCSCSGDDTLPGTGEVIDENKIEFSISFNESEFDKEKSSGNIDNSSNTEKQIYSLDVFIFRSQGEYEAGKRDGSKSISRTVINGNEYKTIDEIKSIALTAGKRDVYVVANAPTNHFNGVNNINDFLAKFEDLQTQGLFDHPGTVTPSPSEPPIGGIDPSDLKTSLTMCNFIKNVSFDNQYQQHYLGYTTNGGRPPSVPSNQGNPVNGTNPFEVERLVARVAIQKIEFDFPTGGLLFESGSAKVTNFTHHIDSVFMMNVKTKSWFPAGVPNALTDNYGHGCDTGYKFLKNGKIANLNPSSQLKTYLTEPIFTQSYDITNIAPTDTPLWYYVFENGESNLYPTFFVIGVRYNFESTRNPGVIKTVKCYYPVVVNAPDTGKTADHDYIKRNYQYGIRVIIKGLGTVYGNNPSELKSAQTGDLPIEVNETVGRNLFPWTGNIYK
ncbi:MAG: fimbrial protein [Dysgonomonas sp.]